MYGNDTIITQLNAKELILAKINATSKFADIYTYLLSIGESFDTIARFMMTPEFKVVADYAEGNMMDQNTRWFDLEHSLNFVLDEETLPNVENRVFMGLLTNNSANWNFLTQLLYGEGKVARRRAFVEQVALNDNLATDWAGIQMYINNILSEQKLKRGDEYTPEYQRLVKFVYNILRQDLSADELLLNLLKQKVESTRVIRVNNEEELEEAVYEQNLDDDYYEDIQEDFESKPAAKWFNAETLKHSDWVNLYRYVAMYLFPKNQSLQGVQSLENLVTLQEKILPALKEQRILAKILGVNQGINTKDFDEYKWIRDIEAFVNELFINSTTIDDVQGFDLIRFLMDEAYKQKMISDYEKVKSTYNVLAIVNSADQFKAMLEMAGRNRRLIEKAYIIKAERKLANALLESNKKKIHNLSIGLTQKLYEKEFQALKNFTEYLIMANWIGSLGDLQLNIPYNRRSPKKYFFNGNAVEFVPGDLLDGLNLAEVKNFIQENQLPISVPDTAILPVLRDTVRDYLSRNNAVIVKFNGETVPFANQIKTVTLNDMDGMATFKWLMEHEIIDKLKQHERFKDNPFIKALQLSSKIDPITQREVEFYSLDIDLGNVKDNSAIENLYNLYLSGFNQIWNEKLPREIGVTSNETGDWTIGDLFYLYNLYVNKDGFGRNSLTRIFDNVVLSDDDNTLLYRYYDYICRLDSGIEQIEDLENLDVRLHGDGTPNLLTEARIALATQPNSSRKFRSEFVPKTDSDEAHYTLLNEKYDIQAAPKVSGLDKNYYLFPFVTIYNPIKILETSEHAKLMNRRKVGDFKVGGKEAVETIVKAMQASFGDTIPIISIDNTWFDHEGRNIKNKALTKTAGGFIYNGKIYINTDNAQVETPIHELMHVVCAALKFGTPEQRNLYYRLLKEINDLGKNREGTVKDIYWSKVIKTISKQYEGIAVGSDLQEEVLVNSLAALFGSGYIHAFGAENPDSIISTSYQEFQNEVYKAIENVFRVKLPAATKSDSMKKLMNMPLAQLLLDFSSSLFNFNGNTLTRVYIPISQKLSEFKTKAVKNSEDTGAQLIFSGDC